MLAYLPFFEMFASETDAIIDRPRLHLCISPDARGEVSFVVERCIEPDRKVVFDSFRFVADDSLKKWRYQVNVFDSRRPCGDMEVRTTLNFTKKDYMLLQACLEDPGSGNDADFVEGGHRLQASSIVSEFLNEVQKLPKFVSLDNSKDYESTGFKTLDFFRKVGYKLGCLGRQEQGEGVERKWCDF